MNGLIVIDKPKGMTSQTVCLKLKRILQLKKCGHNGTLDPDATGVMVVACNQATKCLKLLSEHDKEYIATIVFGYDTDTLDMSGNILEDIPMSPSILEIEEKLELLKQQKTQIPPMTSAIKINGKKLYEYQRQGIEIDIPTREVELQDYEIVSSIRRVENHDEIDLRISVSKGYYVRSLARDLGAFLGGCAVLKELRRVRSGEYTIKEAIPLDKVTLADVVPATKFMQLPTVFVQDYLIPLVRNGVTLDERQTNLHGAFFVDSKEGILAIYEEVSEHKYKPVVIFSEEV